MNKEERMRTEASKAWAELDGLITRMRIEESSAQHEISRLNRKLPKLLVEWAKGKASREQVRALKARIADLREIINDTPAILKELESEKRQRCYRPLEDAGVLSKEREKYHVLKEMILDRFEPDLVEDLRRCAKDIGEENDCEQFLACIAPDLAIESSKAGKS